MKTHTLIFGFVLAATLFLATQVQAGMVHDFDCSSCHRDFSSDNIPLMTYNVCLGCHTPSRYGNTVTSSDGSDSNPITATFSAGDGSNAMGSNDAANAETSHYFAASSDDQPAAGASPPDDWRFNAGWANGLVTCSRCHNPHDSTSNPQLLKLGADSADAMCLDCHRDWNQQNNHGRGSHPMVADYPTLALAEADKFNAVPNNFGTEGNISLVDGVKVSCTSCHGVHWTDSDATTTDGKLQANANDLSDGDGKLLKFDGKDREDPDRSICQTCHTYAEHGSNSGLGCLVCHGGHEYGADPNYYLLRKQLDLALVPKTGAAGTVSLDYTTYPAPANLGGICQQCHTLPVSHDAADSCKDCHSHKAGFGHGAGSSGVGCVECHGHDAGTLYDPDMQAPYTAGTAASQGTGTAQSHSTHTELTGADARGPGIYCDDCHDINDFPYFKSGTDANGDGRFDLSETDVCDTCHSPGGSYDGVDDTVVGAKQIWSTGAYDGTESGTLTAGKQKWCVTCHDEEPSVIAGIGAPNIAGDEDNETFPYGLIASGWGYYKTGHGLASSQTYPSSGEMVGGAAIECSACHDLSMKHVDAEARTYVYTATPGEDNDYQHGYRLKSIDGQPPMEIPRVSECADSGVNAEDFRLCMSCHTDMPFVNSGNMETNFRTDANNAHYLHLAVKTTCGPGPMFASDWRAHSYDSQPSCVTCHNVHGSTQLSMVRDGKLIDKEPGLQVAYNSASVSTPCPGSPSPLDVTLDESTGTVWNPNVGNVCGACHGGCGFSAVYIRTPFDATPPVISGVFGNLGSTQIVARMSELVYSNNDGTGDLLTSDFSLADADNNRTISSVSHTAGDASAQLSLSSALDGTDDFGTDTLSAATAASIFDLAGNAMAVSTHILQEDLTPPTVSDQSPADGTTGFYLDRDINLIMTDAGVGVDWTTFSVQLSGDQGYSKTYTGTDTTVVSKTGSATRYVVTIDPDAFYAYDETITVIVNVSDLLGNVMSPTVWSFTTLAESDLSTVTLTPSGKNASSSGAYYVTSDWASALDTNDGDTSYSYICCTAENSKLYMEMDAPAGLDGATIQSITFHAYARGYLGAGPHPDYGAAVPIDIGYKTGVNTVWRETFTTTHIDTDMAYDLVSSMTYTTDSDGGTLDLTDLENLQLVINWAGGRLRITQLYAEINYLP